MKHELDHLSQDEQERLVMWNTYLMIERTV